jgi:alkylation response protein AidB-like acyl-CoA dehydrogenase
MSPPAFVASGRTAAELLARIFDMVPTIQANAAAADREAVFPTADLERLVDLGCLDAPVPASHGGLGLGTDLDGGYSVAKLLRLLGRGNLSVARIFEAHVNALRLIFLYGTRQQQRYAAQAAHAGRLFALWVTDPPEPLRIVGPTNLRYLSGSKLFCSAAGHASCALVTTTSEDGVHLALISVEPECRPHEMGPPPQGMRATATGRMDLSGIPVPADCMIGQPGDYLREPEFSVGAWRTCAALLGGVDALIAEARSQLIARERDRHPHQLARMGHAFIAQETATMWVDRAAGIAAASAASDGERQAYVNLARIAVERACLEALQLVQRSLGLAAFVPPNPVERLSRDLGTYLRQPAPDEALGDAATWFMRHDLPPLHEASK